MSDDEQQHVSNEELDAERDMEREAEAAAEKHEEAEAEDEGDEKQQQKRDDSDDDSEKSDEAMEDNEEPEVDGDSREPSDGESIDGESDEESETEHEKRIRKAAALQFLDLEADEGTEKKILKHLKKKIIAEDEEENKYEMDSIMDAEDEITYDTDYELERKSKKKKGERKPAAAAATENKKQTKKRKRIRSPLSSEDEQQSSGDSDNDREENTREMTTRDVSDDEMQHMQTLGGTSKAHNVAGQAARPKAAFHEHSDIAKAAAEKKQAKVSPSSLIDSPKLKPKAKNTAPAAAAKSPAKKQRTKKVPTLQVGEQFELKERGTHKVYRISFRGEDAPLVMGPTSNKLELQPGIFHPNYFCTAQMLGETEAGNYKELNKFELFFISPGRAPKRVGVQWATSGWNTFNMMDAKERHAYVISALNHNNIVPGVDKEGKATKRMMFTEPLLQQIKSEAVLNPNGEWKWMPKHMDLPDLITTRDENGEPAVKAAAAAAAASKKKAVAQPKAKIDRIKETNSHNVSTMLHKKAAEQTAAMANSSNGKKQLTIDSKAIQKHTNSSSSSCSVSSNAVLDFFSASPEPTASEPAMLFGTESTRESTKELLVELIEKRHRSLVRMGHKETAGDEIEKSFTFLDVELTKVMESDNDFETKCKEFDEATKRIKGLQLLLIALPFFNVEAAQMIREKLAQM